MSLAFSGLQEFDLAKNSDSLSASLTSLTEGLKIKKLTAVLACHHLFRRRGAKLWLEEVGRCCDLSITLHLSSEPTKPYMQESGGVWLYRRDFYRAGYLLFALAHEGAHFLLMRGEGYQALKELDAQYPKDAPDREMNSPLEYCANLLTLILLEKCLASAKGRGRRQTIQWCITRLKEQARFERGDK